MDQLTQKLKNGAMQIIDVPMPAMSSGYILTRNHYSLISAGTEGSTVKAARMNLLDKAKARPQQVKQVIDTLKSQGITQTYRAVMKKLDAYSPLGYSCVGDVIGVGADVRGFEKGNLVACGGLTACHAEIVSVPVNLCVKIPQDADLKQATYNTLGAIAMQGVRQADLRLGETCAIIGLGLLGQLSALLLKASGIRVIGIDVSQKMVDIAAQHCADLAINREAGGIESIIDQFTDGIGCDAVIIAAATDSLDPVNFAGAILRKRGSAIILGAVPTGFDRDPHFYRKELQVKMSCSYGPGRYDPVYEEKGIDYPVGFVRWTENRNMKAFQELIHSGQIDISYLTTHTFKLEEAPAAYDMMMAKSEPYIGILIEYDTDKPLSRGPVYIHLPHTNEKHQVVTIGFIGAGSYAQSHLIPNIPKTNQVRKCGVMTSSGTSSRSVAERYDFEFCTSEEKDILESAEINTVFIASRHDSHAAYVLKALSAGKHVFVEKPLCLTEEELEDIARVYGAAQGKLHLMVGFNRRFSPLAQIVKKQLADGPAAMHYRVNAGFIPRDSWIQDPEIGGGRIVGEVCHFIDFLTYLNGSLPSSVHAVAMRAASGTNDTVTITLAFRNGSIGTVSYFAYGDKSLPKERVEIFSHGVVYILDDFRSLTIHANGAKKEKKLLVQDKGQKSEVRSFLEAILEGQDAVIPFQEIYAATLVTLKALESLRTGGCVTVSFD